MNLKIEYKQGLKQEEIDLIDAVKRVDNRPVKVSTNKLLPEFDSKDSRNIKALKNLKLIYKLEKGCLILWGTLECEFRNDFRGKFYVVHALKDESVNFDSINGLETEINFSQPTSAISNDMLMSVLKLWSEDPNLVYNIEQFDEFMDLFEFYKELSSERNNETSYKIDKISAPYFFISVDDAEIELKDSTNEEILNQSGIIVGYKLRPEVYEQLSNSIKDKVKNFVDIEVLGGRKVLNRINSIGFDCIYLSNYETITEDVVSQLAQFQVVTINFTDVKLKLSGEVKNSKREYEFLNLYDMGQKIKVESIDNSLRLINQGASGAASELLRYLIGDADMPNKVHSSDEIKEKYMEGLNESQRKAFLMAIDGSPVSLIKGPPGTGKTHVINAIVQYIVKELDEKVIISSQTHIAIDNVLDKLMSNYDPIIPNRITNRKNKYSSTDIDTTLYKTWGVCFEDHNKRAKNLDLATKIKASMTKFNGKKQFSYSKETDVADIAVIGATTTTSAISGKKGLKVLDGFNWLIIDEVSKCPITEVLRYLPYVEKIILVGDDYQLAPLLEFNEDDVKDFKSFDKDKFEKLRAMYESSVFEKVLQKAKKCNRVVLLNENYRSKKNVLALYNVFYENNLIGRREDSHPTTVHLRSKILEDNIDIFFVEVLHGKEVIDDKKSRYNIEELHATADVMEKLMESTTDPSRVSVAAIFPYGAQISRFQKEYAHLINEAKRKFKSFNIDTVDAFQGKEADIVLCNTVLADISKVNNNFLTDFRRINVSMSRAKDKLIIFGNSTVLSQINMSVAKGPKRKFFKDIISYIECNGKKIIYDGGIKDDNRSKNSINFA